MPGADTRFGEDRGSPIGRTRLHGTEVTEVTSPWRRATTFGAALALASTLVELAVIPLAHAAAPVVVVFLPTTGVSGTSVTINGTGFADSSGATGVVFNGTPAPSFSVDADTQITAIVPVG